MPSRRMVSRDQEGKFVGPKPFKTLLPLLCTLGLAEEPSLDIAQALESSGDFFLVFLTLFLLGLQLPFQHMRNEFFN